LDHKELTNYETHFISAAEKIAKCVFNVYSGEAVFDEAADVYFFQDYGACLSSTNGLQVGFLRKVIGDFGIPDAG
jgi:uncharacterized protein YneR